MSTTLLTRIVFATLAVATVGAFFAAQWLKQSPAAVQGIERTRVFSPDGNGVRDVAEISFVLRASEDIDVAIVNGDGDVVRELADSVPVRAYRRATFTWDGRDDDGGRAPPGEYRARVVLAREGRTAEIPATMTLDVSRPRAEIVSVKPAVLPARGPRAVEIRFRGQVRAAGAQLLVYRVRAPATSRPALVTAFRAPRGKRIAEWDGRIGGRPAPAGRYVFGLRVRDVAGNVASYPRTLPPSATQAPRLPAVTILEARRRRR